MRTRIWVMMLVTLLVPVAFADTPDDAIKLTQSGVSEEVLEAWAQHHTAPLTAQEILRMRDSKVPEKVIAIMLRNDVNVNDVREQRTPAQPLAASYVESVPTTTYVETPSTVYYSDPYYYGYGYGYPYGGVGLSFNFGHGHYSGYRGGFGHHR